MCARESGLARDLRLEFCLEAAMDVDMHYYGTYALARAAGLAPDVALRARLASLKAGFLLLLKIVRHEDQFAAPRVPPTTYLLHFNHRTGI